MANQFLDFSGLTLDPQGGAISLILNGNVDTTMRARCFWLPDDKETAEESRIVGPGEAFVVDLPRVKQASVRRLAFVFIGTPLTPAISRLFVRLAVFQAPTSGALLQHDYATDLQQGQNKWQVADGVTLLV